MVDSRNRFIVYLNLESNYGRSNVLSVCCPTFERS